MRLTAIGLASGCGYRTATNFLFKTNRHTFAHLGIIYFSNYIRIEQRAIELNK